METALRFGNCLAIALLVLLGTAGSAAAGVADAVPLINGVTRAKHVFTVPGAKISANTGTVVMCTSLEKSKDIDLAVEVFSSSGGVLNDITVSEGVLTGVAPGVTRTFEVMADASGIAYTTGNSIVNIGTTVAQGSLRILSTSTKIACTAANIDEAGNPPAFVWPLHVVSKTKQKGD